jgi:hypothetical protein
MLMSMSMSMSMLMSRALCMGVCLPLPVPRWGRAAPAGIAGRSVLIAAGGRAQACPVAQAVCSAPIWALWAGVLLHLDNLNNGGSWREIVTRQGTHG